MLCADNMNCKCVSDQMNFNMIPISMMIYHTIYSHIGVVVPSISMRITLNLLLLCCVMIVLLYEYMLMIIVKNEKVEKNFLIFHIIFQTRTHNIQQTTYNKHTYNIYSIHIHIYIITNTHTHPSTNNVS